MDLMEQSVPEGIETFLKRLKLPDKYLQCFLNNGISTVDDCTGLDENKLKTMGITLPGHLRRILNKLPGCEVKKPPRNSKMDSLSPESVSNEKARRHSSELQYLESSADRTATADIKEATHPPQTPPDLAEDPYLTWSANATSSDADNPEIWLDDTSVPPVPLSPSNVDIQGTYEENPYEMSTLSPLPPLPLDGPDLTSLELRTLSPLPSPPPDIVMSRESVEQEDPYLTEMPTSREQHQDFFNNDRDLIFKSPQKIRHHSSGSPESGVADIELGYDYPSPNADARHAIRQSAFDDDDYDHLAEGDPGAPQSPSFISSAVADIFTQSPKCRDIRTQSSSGNDEDLYDRLDSNGLHSKLSRQNSPSYLTPPGSRSHSRSPSSGTNTAVPSAMENRQRSRSDAVHSEGEKFSSARNMPLPSLPWKAVIGQENVAVSQGSFSSMNDMRERDYWAQDDAKLAQEGDYDTLALTRNGNTNYKSKPMITSIKSAEMEPEDDYEVVAYPLRDEENKKNQTSMPPAPHNTPSHTLDGNENSEDEYADYPASYEEVEFFPRSSPQGNQFLDRSMTIDSGASKGKQGKEKRRLTAVQDKLQKAKAKMKERAAKVKGFAKLENKIPTTPLSQSDNESLESYPSRKGSTEILYKSLEDLTSTGLPPHPQKPSRQISDVSFESNSSPNRRGHLTRMSPITRRKRDSSTRYSSDMESAYSVATPFHADEDAYETFGNGNDVRVRKETKGASHISPVVRKRMEKTKDLGTRRPMSVFMDFKSSLSVDDLDEDKRTRTYSATLKRDSAVSVTDVLPDTYMDIPERSTRVIPIMALSPLTKKRTKSGWLWKHGGHDGRAPLRRRWVVFDGEEMAYFESNTKTEFSKGIIPVEVMMKIHVPPSDSLVFHVQTKGGRIYMFQAESSDERTMWTNILMYAMMTFEGNVGHQFKPGGKMYMPYKEGLLKMDGIRQKVYLAIKGEQAAYYKDEKLFTWAQPVARLQMKLATVKDVDKKKFQLVFPYRTFIFTAESEEEKKSWIDHLLEAIAEGLSDYKVLNEVWANEANKKCADCGKMYPDWASINLAIIICKHCAGVHRELGVQNSKVRSLKMDIRIWDNTMKRLLLDIGNNEANRFWAHDLRSSDAITDMADKNQRSWFINSKYMDKKYALERREEGDQEMLNLSLINAIREDDLLQAYQLVFSGADVNCFTGKEHAKSPVLLAEYLTYTTLAEFIRQNGGTDVTSPEGHISERNSSMRKKDSIPKNRVKPPVCMKDCLWKYGGDFKGASEENKKKGKVNIIMSVLQPGDFQKRLCVLENNTLKYCDPEKPSIIKDYISCNDLISITVHTPEQAIKAGYKHCFELSRTSGRTFLFCADREDTRKKWTRGLMQAIVPPYIQNVMECEEEYDRIGKLKLKAKRWSKTNSEWSSTWCRLRKKKLQYFHNEARTMETIDLRKLVQITVDQTQEIPSNQTNGLQNKETIPVIMLVFREKSYYIHSATRQDTEAWMAAIKRSDNESGHALEQQQLTAEGVPIVLEKCLTYVEQFGITMRGIYRLSGIHSKTTQLLNDFRQNARETQMREGDLDVHDVANALKRWFKSLPGSLFTEELHQQWIETAQIQPEHHQRKMEWYKHLIEKLPEINQKTLKQLLKHLRHVSHHEKENEMSLHNIAIVFGPTLMEPQSEESGGKYLGQTSQEIGCIEDLLQYYDWLFDVTDMDRERDEMMRQAQEKINIAKQQQNMLTTLDYDMMVPIYINRKEDKCANYKVNLSAGDLVCQVCLAHGYPADKWGIYEVISDGDAERPLHFTEHVLGVIKSWDMPSTNYLVAKNDYMRDKMRWFKQTMPSDAETIMEGHLRHYEGKKKWSKVNGTLARTKDGIVSFKYVKTASESSTLDLREMASAHWRKRSVKTRSKVIGWTKFGNMNDASAKTTVSIDVNALKVYVGVDKKTKPPGNGKQGFTLLKTGEPANYFVAETEGDMYRWISHMLLCMHPEGFTPPVSNESTPSKSSQNAESSGSRGTYGSISQQELGELVARAADLKRTSSNESTGSARERFQHDRGQSGSCSPSYYSSPQGSHSPHPSSAIPEDAPLISLEDGPGLEAVYDMHRPRYASSSSNDLPLRPGMLPGDSLPRRPVSHYALSPGDPRTQRAGLGIQLRDELSNVLRKRTQ